MKLDRHENENEAEYINRIRGFATVLNEAFFNYTKAKLKELGDIKISELLVILEKERENM
jgi:hypothetical protein